MSVWVTVADVTDRWVGDGLPTNNVTVQTILDDVEEILRVEFPTLADDVDADPAMLPRVRLVASRMATRALRYPEGLRQVQETAGPFTNGYSIERNPGIWISDEERGLLAGVVGGSRPGAFTINTVSDLTPEPPDPWTGWA